MTTLLSLPTGTIATALSQNADFVSACAQAKADLLDPPKKMDALNQQIALLSAQICKEVIAATVTTLAPVKVTLDPKPNRVSLLTSAYSAASEMDISLLMAHAHFHHSPDRPGFVEQEITSVPDDDYVCNLRLDCNDIGAEALVSASMICATFINATSANATGILADTLKQLKACLIEHSNLDRDLQVRKNLYAPNLLKTFCAGYKGVTAVELLTLWDAPKGTQLRFISLRCKSGDKDTAEPKLIIDVVPNILSVEGEGDSRRLVYCRKTGHGGFLGPKLPGLTDELHRGALVFQPDTVMFPSSLLIDGNTDLDAVSTLLDEPIRISL